MPALKIEPKSFREVEAAKLVKQQGGPIVVQGEPGSGKTYLLGHILRQESRAVLVRIPRGLDQIEATILGLGHALGPSTLEDAAAALRDDPSRLAPSLKVLADHLATTEQRLLVDDIDLLQGRPAHPLGDLRMIRTAEAHQLRDWLRERAFVLTCRRGAADQQLEAMGSNPPAHLVNGADADTSWLWTESSRDPRTYFLALVRAVLSGEAPSKDADFDDDVLREDILALLPGGSARALRLLAIHGRPLPREVLHGLGVSNADVEQLQGWHLADTIGGNVATDRGWTSWIRRATTMRERRPLHAALAETLASGLSLDDPTWLRRAHWLSEAHRHFVRAGDFHRAAEFLQFGVSLVLDDARRRSLSQRFGEAIERYEAVLRIDRKLPNVGNGIGSQARAYALHYLHYNRAKRSVPEPIQATRKGYLASTDLWPENALFWSRAVLVQIYAGDPEAALKSLGDAYAHVAEHPLRNFVLRARTAQKLVERAKRNASPGAYEAAMEVWADHRASVPREQEVSDLLHSALASGWTTTSLRPAGQDALHFHRPQHVRIRHLSGKYAAELPALSMRPSRTPGPSPIAAYRTLTARVRDRTAELLRTPSHQLDATTRLEKRGLLATVDVVASRLIAPAGAHTWVFGQIRRDGGRALVLDAGPSAGVFAVPDALAGDAVVSDSWWFGRLEAGPAGEPVGPLVTLEPTTTDDPDDLWDRWRNKVSGE